MRSLDKFQGLLILQKANVKSIYALKTKDFMPTIIVGISRLDTSFERVRRGTSEIDRAIDSNRIIRFVFKIKTDIASP